MIICHRYGFIFLKTRKTASSSVEIALSRACGEGDVVTPLVEHLGEEELRRAEGGYGPAGHRKAVREHRGFTEWRRLLTRGQRARRFDGLVTASTLRSQLPQSIWSSYTKVSIERNPWDRALSRYWWNRYRWEREGKWAFDGLTAFLRYLAAEKPEQLSNWWTYAIGDDLAVDHMLFYEDLDRGLQELRSTLGIVEDVSLPATRAKSGFRREQQHYSEALSPEDRAIIDTACAREIRMFGYEFDA